MGNDPFPGAGQNPAQEGVLDGVGEIVSGVLRMRKNSDKMNSHIFTNRDGNTLMREFEVTLNKFHHLQKKRQPILKVK